MGGNIVNLPIGNTEVIAKKIQVASKIKVQGTRYPENLERLTGRRGAAPARRVAVEGRAAECRIRDENSGIPPESTI